MVDSLTSGPKTLMWTIGVDTAHVHPGGNAAWLMGAHRNVSRPNPSRLRQRHGCQSPQDRRGGLETSFPAQEGTLWENNIWTHGPMFPGDREAWWSKGTTLCFSSWRMAGRKGIWEVQPGLGRQVERAQNVEGAGPGLSQEAMAGIWAWRTESRMRLQYKQGSPGAPLGRCAGRQTKDLVSRTPRRQSSHFIFPPNSRHPGCSCLFSPSPLLGRILRNAQASRERAFQGSSIPCLWWLTLLPHYEKAQKKDDWAKMGGKQEGPPKRNPILVKSDFQKWHCIV